MSQPSRVPELLGIAEHDGLPAIIRAMALDQLAAIADDDIASGAARL